MIANWSLVQFMYCQQASSRFCRADWCGQRTDRQTHRQTERKKERKKETQTDRPRPSVCSNRPHLQGGPKSRATNSLPYFCQILTDLRIFFTGRFLGKLSVKWVLKIPPHLAYVATLPCETLLSAKQATDYKLQGSVAIRLRCGGVVNSQIKKRLLLSLRVKKINRSSLVRVL